MISEIGGGNGKFKNLTSTNSFNKISLELNGEYIEVHHYMENIFNIVNENINSNPGKLLDLNNLYMNPIDNLVIVVDRKLWSELYLPLLKNHYDIFYKFITLFL